MRRRSISVLLVLIALFLSGTSARALATPKINKTLDQIFREHAFDTRQFGPARWIDGSAAYTTLEASKAFPEPGVKEIVRYETKSGQRTVLVSASEMIPAPGAKPLVLEDYAWSSNNQHLLIYTNSKKVWRRNTRGDYWVLDLANKRLRKLGGDAPESSLMFAEFSPDGQSVAYVRANNIYVEDISSNAIRALTSNGSSTLINGTSDWVNEEELDIRKGFYWSPDGQSIAYWQFDTSGVGVYTLINDTAEEYPTLKRYPYPQVGTTNSAVRVGVVSARGGPTRWMDIPGDPRNYYIARVAWSGNSNTLALEYLNRPQNDVQVLFANVQTGAVRKLLEDRDPAWVDVVESFQWADDGNSLLWMSERDGWRHVYKVSRVGGPLHLLTSFPADVIAEVAVDDKAGWFYYIASPNNATEQYLYRVHLDGSGQPERVTPQHQPGTHSYDISPDRHWAFHTYSTFDHPPITDLITLPEHQVVRTLERNEELARKVNELTSTPTDFFQVAIDGGVKLDGWMIKPRDFDPEKKYPVLVYVYGEPAAVTVTDKWDSVRSLFHRAIADGGYIVVSFDSQGTPAPKGRVWRKMIYGDIGVLSSAEQAEAIRAFAKNRPYVDSSRMAVWGWSGGGSNTLNLMFRSPGLFSAGMAVAPVADQRYYDTIYQERYMGLPKDNPRGYHDGSPINFAQGLQGKLLIVHGSGDDNCHFKMTELLLNHLIALGKPFDFMDYPNRTHAISEGPGTSYHLYSLLARYLEEHVPPGGLPR